MPRWWDPAGAALLFGVLWRHNARQLAWVTTIQVGAAAGQGVGVLLLVPLLQAAHVAKGSSTNGIAQAARNLFDGLGIHPTLATALIFYVGVAGTAVALSAYASVRGTRYTLEFVDSLRNDLYAAIAAAPWRHMLTPRRSDLLNALTVNTMQTYAAVTALLALQGTLMLT